MSEYPPELRAILRTGKLSRFRIAELFCPAATCGRFAEILRSPAGPILVGLGLLATEEGDRQRRGRIVRYLAREPAGAAVSLQCRCSNHPMSVAALLQQRGYVEVPRARPQPD